MGPLVLTIGISLSDDEVYFLYTEGSIDLCKTTVKLAILNLNGYRYLISRKEVRDFLFYLVQILYVSVEWLCLHLPI